MSRDKKDLNIYKCPVDFIKIGPFDYEIRWLDHADFTCSARHGQCEDDYHVLYIISTINKWRMLDTLYHEINHAIVYVFGLKIDNDTEEEEKNQKYRSEEQYVNTIASGWLMINRDNFEFREWINNLYKD